MLFGGSVRMITGVCFYAGKVRLLSDLALALGTIRGNLCMEMI
jgi:hypothetical protein